MRISILKALGSLLTSLLAMVGNGPEPAARPVRPVASPATSTSTAEADRRIPQAVLDAVRFAYPAGVLDLERSTTDVDVDDDETTYKIRLTNHGERCKVELDSSGAIKKIKAELDPLDLPPAVIESVARRFRFGATTTALERVEAKDGRETKVFDLVVVHQGRPLEVEVRPDGVIEDVDE